MGNIWASHNMLGTSIDSNLNRNTSPEEYFEFAKKNSIDLFSEYKDARIVANTFRLWIIQTITFFLEPFIQEIKA